MMMCKKTSLFFLIMVYQWFTIVSQEKIMNVKEYHGLPWFTYILSEEFV